MSHGDSRRSHGDRYRLVRQIQVMVIGTGVIVTDVDVMVIAA